jgi:hypothetical protein
VSQHVDVHAKGEHKDMHKRVENQGIIELAYILVAQFAAAAAA